MDNYLRKNFKVLLTNSAIIVNDYEFGESPSLEYNFKIYDPLIHTTVLVGMYYDEKNKQLYLPRGIDISYVMRKLESKNTTGAPYEYTTVHCHGYGRIDNMLLKYPPRDDRQVEALRFMLCKEKYIRNQSKSQFSVNLPTGAGKTYCSVATIAYSGIKSIIITAQSGILEQWKKSIINYTNLSDTDICKLEGSAMIDRIISGKSKFIDCPIYMVTHSTLKSYGDSHGWEAVGKLFEILKIGIKIYDEAHQNFTNMAMIDFFTNVYRTYYVTATPNRSNKDENRVYSLYMKSVPSVNLFDENSDPHTKYIAIRYNSNPRPIDISNCKNAYGLDRMKYINYLMGNENFWMMFDYIFNMIEKQGGRALFYIGTNDAILKVRDRIVRHYPEYVDDIGIYTSLAENKQEERNKRFILSTTKSAGAGEDIKGLKYSIVLAEPFKSDVLTKQTLGRTRDKDTYYLELVDIGFKQTNNYYNAKKPIFNKYALSTKQLDVPKYHIKDIAQTAYEERINRGIRVLEFNVPEYQEVVKFVKDPMIEVLQFYE